MQNNLTINIEDNESNERLDVFLGASLTEYSRSQIQKMIKNGEITVNNKPSKNSYRLKEKDIITIVLRDREIEIKPENIPLDIRYEDENMLVINKPKNMLTHPTTKEFSGTLVNALLFYCKGNLSNINGIMRQGIVHRLDRNTTGLIMVAKNNETHEYLASQIKNRFVEKKYITVVHGIIEKDEGEIDLPIGRNMKHPEKMCIIQTGKPSLTKYKVLERFKNNTLLELTLVTGRTHQIRVHMSAIGHPVVNDSLYSGITFKVKTLEQLLQSYELTFIPYKCNNTLTLKLDYDESIMKVLRYLRSIK